MKNPHKLATVGMGTAWLLAATGGHAQSANPLYLDAYGGAAFQMDATLKAGSVNSSANNNHIKFDTGFRAGAELGYKINESFALELDASVIRNTINQVGIQTLSGVPGASASLDEIPLLVNGIYTLPLKGAFKPYVGVGVGATIGVFNSSNIPGTYPPLGNDHHFDSTDYTFAYQAELGFKYALGRHMDLGLAYKFVGTTAHDWAANNVFLKTDGTLTHTIEATFTWRF